MKTPPWRKNSSLISWILHPSEAMLSNQYVEEYLFLIASGQMIVQSKEQTEYFFKSIRKSVFRDGITFHFDL